MPKVAHYLERLWLDDFFEVDEVLLSFLIFLRVGLIIDQLDILDIERIS